jgi:hypothetical protein
MDVILCGFLVGNVSILLAGHGSWWNVAGAIACVVGLVDNWNSRRRLLRRRQRAPNAAPAPIHLSALGVLAEPPAPVYAAVVCRCKRELHFALEPRDHEARFTCDCGVVHVFTVKVRPSLAHAPFSVN